MLKNAEWEILNIQPGPYVDHVGDGKDLSRFGDETFAELYASHIAEHFDYAIQEVFTEWRRVLTPDGKLYMSVPDLEVLCRLFLNRKDLNLGEHIEVMRMMFGGHVDQYDYHSIGLDFDILRPLLYEAGFKKVERVESLGIFNDSSTFRFKGAPVSLNVIAFK